MWVTDCIYWLTGHVVSITTNILWSLFSAVLKRTKNHLVTFIIKQSIGFVIPISRLLI